MILLCPIQAATPLNGAMLLPLPERKGRPIQRNGTVDNDSRSTHLSPFTRVRLRSLFPAIPAASRLGLVPWDPSRGILGSPLRPLSARLCYAAVEAGPLAHLRERVPPPKPPECYHLRRPSPPAVARGGSGDRRSFGLFAARRSLLWICDGPYLRSSGTAPGRSASCNCVQFHSWRRR